MIIYIESAIFCLIEFLEKMKNKKIIKVFIKAMKSDGEDGFDHVLNDIEIEILRLLKIEKCRVS